MVGLASPRITRAGRLGSLVTDSSAMCNPMEGNRQATFMSAELLHIIGTGFDIHPETPPTGHGSIRSGWRIDHPIAWQSRQSQCSWSGISYRTSLRSRGRRTKPSKPSR